MKKYECYVRYCGTLAVELEAESEEQARKLAEQEYEEMPADELINSLQILAVDTDLVRQEAQE